MTHLAAKPIAGWVAAFAAASALEFVAIGLQTSLAVAHGDHVVNSPPDCTSAAPSKAVLENDKQGTFEEIKVLDITDPDGDEVTLEIFNIWQDEPVIVIEPGEKTKKKHTTPDGMGIDTDTAQVRAERDNKGDGRVYHITVRATDEHDAICFAVLTVSVPRHKNKPAIDGGPLYDSRNPDPS